MENWQFLIQQQGDRSWRPLESPNEEIIEGRYRVVARSSRANMDVEVRIVHTSTLEMPPKRRIQRRTRRTNAEGLMAVIPYTYLKPGIWELRCSSDLVSDVLGTPWQQSVRLQVLPKVTITQGEQENENKEVLAAESQIENEEEIIAQPVNPVWLKGETAEQIVNHLIELAIPDSEQVLEDEKAVADSPESVPDCPLALTLDKEIYTVSWGENITINGSVKLKETEARENIEKIYSGEIRVELHSPQGSELIRRVRQSLPEKLIPFNIRCSVEIPTECASKLILADVSLYGTISVGGDTLLLARESFTIAADVAELLAISTTANQSTTDIVEDTQAQSALTITSDTKKSNITLDLELFNLVKTAKTSQPVIANPVVTKTLPPSIKRRSLRQSAPQLPTVSQRQNQQIASSVVVPALPSADKEDSLTAIGQTRSRGTTFPYLRRITVISDDKQKVEGKPIELFNFQPPIHNQQILTETHNEDFSQLEVGKTQFQDESLIQDLSESAERDTQPQVEPLNDSSQLVVEKRQSQEQVYSNLVPPSNAELIVIGDSFTSPLIKKWMQTQGYSIPEPINLQDQDQDYDITTVPVEAICSESRSEAIAVTQEQEKVENQATGTETQEQGDAENQATGTETQEQVAIDSVADVVDVADELPASPTDSPSVATFQYGKTPSMWLAQEIVVDDDTFDEPLADTSIPNPSQEEEQTGVTPTLLPSTLVIAEPLPVPQLFLPKGELISGKSIMVRVQLSERRPELAVKLWVEDCQTRVLIDGPRWLTNLLPLISPGMEELVQINVPFGCLEIRVEAIAVDMATQQESDKVSIQRAVVPPDLPTLLPDELLGI
ncbi:hypothetical protein NUACC21_06980 [Scytonema sp. NUACC21]